MNPPRGRIDLLAAVVLGGAAALAIALSVILLIRIGSEPATAPSAPSLAEIAASLEKLVARVGEPAPSAPQMPAQPSGRLVPEAGRTWRYSVELEPPIWRDATLTYRTVSEPASPPPSLAVHTEFRHAGGTMKFRLGALRPDDPRHAHTRFPGFFLHTAYIEFPLRPGQQLGWSWAWQMPRGGLRKGRVKRYAARVVGWENVQVPAGRYDAVRIEATLSYVDDGKVQASAKETFWIAPETWQIVKIERQGATPDEGARRIVAELVEFR